MWIRWFEKWIDPWSDCLWHKWWLSESTTSKRSRTDLGELPWYLSGGWNKFCELKVLNKQKAVHLVRDDALNRGYSQKDECGNAEDSIGQESCGSWVRRKISCNWVSGGWRRCHTSIRAANRYCIHANSPRLCGSRLDTTPVVSHTGHHISRIKSSFELICVLVWDLAHF